MMSPFQKAPSLKCYINTCGVLKNGSAFMFCEIP